MKINLNWLLPPMCLALGVAGTMLYGWLSSSAASATITGPTTARVGEIVILDGSSSAGQSFEWRIVPSAESKNLGDGRSAAAFPAQGQYVVTFSVKSAAGGRFTEAEARHVVQVGDAPGPVPPPVPPVPPGPPPIPPPSGLRAAAKAHAEATINGAGRVAQAKLVAEAYRDIASAIGAGVLTTPVDIASATLDRMDRDLGADRPAWNKWLTLMDAEPESKVPKDFSAVKIRDAWLEIAAGLDEVK